MMLTMVLMIIWNLDQSAADEADDGGPGEHAGSDVGEVGQAEDDQRLQHPHLLHGHPDHHHHHRGYPRSHHHHHTHQHHALPCEQCSGKAKDDTNKKSATDDSEEGENAEKDLKVIIISMTKAAVVDNLAKSDCFSSVLHPDKDVHHIVKDDGHTIVEQRLAKDQVVEVRVHSNLDEKFDFFCKESKAKVNL